MRKVTTHFQAYRKPHDLTLKQAIVIGGGPAGITAALRLKQLTDVNCTIYELRPEPSTSGGAVGIFPNGLRLFSRLGLYEELLKRGSSESVMSLHSMGGSLLGEQDMVHEVREEIGFGYLRIKRYKLLEALLNAADTAQIPIHYGKRIISITEDDSSVTATFSDGTTDTADFLLGCDGIHSAVRKLHVDPEQDPVYSGFAGVGSIISTAGLDVKGLKMLKGINATLTEQGAFAVMKVTPGGDEIFWGLSRQVPLPEEGDTRDGWDETRKKQVDGFKRSVMDIIGNVQGEWGDFIKSAVAKTEAVQFYPTFKLPAGRAWHKGRCLLLGDAAHAIPPHAGQGTSMVLEDVCLVSQLLKDPSRSFSEVCEEFEKFRKPRLAQVAEQTEKNAAIRKDTGPIGLKLKQFMIWAYFSAVWVMGRQPPMISTLGLLAYDVEAEVA